MAEYGQTASLMPLWNPHTTPIQYTRDSQYMLRSIKRTYLLYFSRTRCIHQRRMPTRLKH